MENIKITGGYPLEGSVSIQGSKNAVLPLIAASLLTREKVVLKNCPKIDDVYVMLDIMRELGCEVSFNDHTVEIDSSFADKIEITPESAKRLRASILFLGALMGRCKKAVLPYPGGCMIGKRPIDFHLYALGKMGVVFETENDRLVSNAEQLNGSHISFYKKSVGATQNTILTAVLANGTTRIKGAAIEPEVLELCAFLRKMGAVILRTDYDEFLIKGVEHLSGVTYCVPSDRIVAGTYLISAVATRGKIRIENAPVNHMQSVINTLKRMNAKITIDKNCILLDAGKATGGLKYIATDNYPGFPTDLQSQLLAALTIAENESIVEEKIFESRFKIVNQLKKMGADITIENRKLFVKPVENLKCAGVNAEDLRGGAALIIAGLIANGETIVGGCEYIARGYENIVEDIRSLGADICYC